MKVVSLINGLDDPDAEAAINAEKLKEAGADHMALSRYLAEVLSPIAAMLNPGYGIVLMDQGDTVTATGVRLSVPEINNVNVKAVDGT